MTQAWGHTIQTLLDVNSLSRGVVDTGVCGLARSPRARRSRPGMRNFPSRASRMTRSASYINSPTADVLAQVHC